MKKVILSLAALVISATCLLAQTNAVTSGNLIEPGLNGFTFEFNGTLVDNCSNSNGINSVTPAPTNQTWTTDGSGKLVVTVPTMTAYNGDAQTAKFYTGNCVSATLDLSATADQKIAINLNSPMAGQLVVIFYSGASSNYANTPNVFALVSGANTLSATVDLTGITSSSVSGIGFVFRGATGWGDYNFSGTVNVENVKVGAVTTTGTNVAVNNSLLSVYPNPAKDQINIDLSSMNTSDASVKIMNANGTLVYEGRTTQNNETINTSSFNRGMYLVQVSSGNNVSNKKIVIE